MVFKLEDLQIVPVQQSPQAIFIPSDRPVTQNQQTVSTLDTKTCDRLQH